MSIISFRQANTLKDPEAEFRAMGKRAFEIPKLTLALVIVLPQLLPFFKKLFSLRLVDKDVTNFFTRSVFTFMCDVATHEPYGPGHATRHIVTNVIWRSK